MANKVKLGFIIAALTLFLLPFKVDAVIDGSRPSTPTPTNMPTPTSTSTPTPEPTAKPTVESEQEMTPTIMEEDIEENGEIISAEEESTATPTEETKEESSPTNIWQMATFGLVIAFLAIIIGFILGGKRDQKEKPKSQKEEENEDEESEE